MIGLKIKVTKDILLRSALCGMNEDFMDSDKNCAIALAVRDIFPYASVTEDAIEPFAYESGQGIYDYNELIRAGHTIQLPEEARSFINNFDISSPPQRMNMEEFEFEIFINDKIIERIDIDEIKSLLENHPSLQLI